jgi:hypothetical protein
MGMDLGITGASRTGASRRPHEVKTQAFRRFEASAPVSATPDDLFARLDDQAALAEHMQRSSAMMGGGRMTYDFDADRGRAVGSHIRMGGSAFGLSLFVDEVVTERTRPGRKTWQTVGEPRLLIIGQYRMGFEIAPSNGAAVLKVWIAYTLPDSMLGKLLGTLFAGVYARWCVNRMIRDAAQAFPAEPG